MVCPCRDGYAVVHDFYVRGWKIVMDMAPNP